jgi:hypothetical protein
MSGFFAVNFERGEVDVIKMDLSEKKQRSDKKIRVNPSLDQDTHRKLKRLSLACDLPKTKLAEEIIKIAVNNPSLIEYIQKVYNASDEFRVVPIVDKGKIYFLILNLICV